MRIGGIILVVIGVLGLIQNLMRMGQQHDNSGEGIAFGIGFIVLGPF